MEKTACYRRHIHSGVHKHFSPVMESIIENIIISTPDNKYEYVCL
jgi:hypothetical protein